MKQTKTFGVLLSLFALMLSAHAQFNGTVGIQTASATVWTNQSTTATSSTILNLGQSTHVLMFCISSLFIGTIDLEGSKDGVNWIVLQIANYSVSGNLAAQCHILQAGGYYPNIRSKVVVGGGTISAWYSATAAPTAPVPSGLATLGPLPPVVCDRAGTTGSISTGTTSNILGPSNTGDGVYLCGFSISLAGAASAGSINLQWSTSISCTSPFTSWTVTTTASTPQLIIVPTPQVSPGGLASTPQFLCVQNASGVGLIFNYSEASVHVP